ncbi:hypothetical protein V5K00_RS22970 [Enterobacter asburiae]
MLVTETLSGDTHLRPYVKDPVELNKDIVALVAQQMADALIEHAGRHPDGAIPDTTLLENTMFPCSRCGRITARLVFAPECTSEADMMSLSSTVSGMTSGMPPARSG